jgi:hypothetical protein
VATVVKGPDSIADLDSWAKWLVVTLLGLGLGALVAGTLVAVRATFGAPGDRVYSTGEELRRWTLGEVRRIGRGVAVAGLLLPLGLALLAAGIGVSWLGPRAAATPHLVSVQWGGQRVCGRLVGAHDGRLVVTPAGRAPQLIPLAEVSEVVPVQTC